MIFIIIIFLKGQIKRKTYDIDIVRDIQTQNNLYYILIRLGSKLGYFNMFKNIGDHVTRIKRWPMLT
jgi:hypothetical protein